MYSSMIIASASCPPDLICSTSSLWRACGKRSEGGREEGGRREGGIKEGRREGEREGGREGGREGEEGLKKIGHTHFIQPPLPPTPLLPPSFPSLPPSPASPHIFSSAVLEPSSVLLTDVPRCHALVAKHHGPAEKCETFS